MPRGAHRPKPKIPKPFTIGKIRMCFTEFWLLPGCFFNEATVHQTLDNKMAVITLIGAIKLSKRELPLSYEESLEHLEYLSQKAYNASFKDTKAMFERQFGIRPEYGTEYWWFGKMELYKG